MRYFSLLLVLLLAACNMTAQTPVPEITEVNLPTDFPEETSAVEIPTNPARFVAYWIGSDQLIHDGSVMIGCQTYVSPIQSSTSLGTPEENIRNSLNMTFTTAPAAGQRNIWAEDMDFVVDSVVIENGQATIQLNGNIMLRGTCADVEMEAQVLLAVFSEDSVQSALIMIGNTNMREFFDMSGQSTSDFRYTRDNIPYANP